MLLSENTKEASVLFFKCPWNVFHPVLLFFLCVCCLRIISCPLDARLMYLSASTYTSNYILFQTISVLFQDLMKRGEKKIFSSHPLSSPISHSSNCLLQNLYFSHPLNVPHSQLMLIPSTLEPWASSHQTCLPTTSLLAPFTTTPVGVGYLRPGVRVDAEVSVALLVKTGGPKTL